MSNQLNKLTGAKEKVSTGDTHRRQVTTPTGSPGAKETEKNELAKSTGKTPVDSFYGFMKKWAVPVTSWGSFISCIGSFLLATGFKKKGTFLDKISTWFSKVSVFATGAYGALINYQSKNTFGMVGYISDMIVSAIASDKRLYLLRAIGSGLDQIPSMLKDFASKFKNKIQKDYSQSPDEFVNFKKLGFSGFWDSAKKTFYASKEIFGDIASNMKEEYKQGGLWGALKTVFDVKKAERSHLLSSIGLVTSGLLGGFLGYDKIFGSIRDAFGLYADYAISSKGASTDSEGKETGAGNQTYLRSGLFDLAGTVLDFFGRFFPNSNTHLLGLGASRFAARDLAEAQDIDNATLKA